MEDQNNPLDTLASAYEFDAVDGDRNAADSSGSLTLEELNSVLGRTYKDKETALKSLKDTQSMVGKIGNIEKEKETLNKKLMETTQIGDELKQIKDELFYTKNPQYAPYRDTIAAMGSNPAEIVEKEGFKKIFADLSEYEKTKSAKSVLETNPRIGVASTRIGEAKDLASKGQYTNANENAVAAVMDLYDLK
jgi:hypothetical protein